jgi:hypothetical protein
MKDRTIEAEYGIVGTSGVGILEMQPLRVSTMPNLSDFLPALYSFGYPEQINSDPMAYLAPKRAYHEQLDVKVIQSMGRLYNEIFRLASQRWEYDMEDLIIQSIITKYQGIDSVESIYSNVQNDLYNAYVFIETPKYNRTLMNRLFDLEMDIEDNFPGKDFEFHYVPIGVGKHDIVPRNYKCIFAR